MVVLSLLACLIAGLAFAWLLYRNTGHLDKRLRYTLFTVRALVLTIVLGLLVFPLVRSISYELQKPVIVIGQDNSLSIGHVQPAGFQKEQYEKDIQRLAEQLSDEYEVKVYHFGDSIKEGFNFDYRGKLTNANQLIMRLKDELADRNVGAVILASDGLFNRGGSPLYELDKLKAPVYTIALGDTIPKKDLVLTNVSHNSLVYLDNEFTLDVQLEAFESKAEAGSLVVMHNGKKVFEQSFQIPSNPFSKSIPVRLKADKIGLQRYTIQLSPLPDEVSKENNVRQVQIEVIDARQKILIAAAAPHPDIAALRNAVTLNKHFEVKVSIGEELNTLNPTDYDLVILYQIPAQQINPSPFVAKLASTKSSLWYIIGAQSNLPAFRQLPGGLNFSGNTGSLQAAYSEVDPRFTAFNLDAASAKTLAQFDPLQAPFGKVMVPANASVALNQRIGKVSTNSPQLFFISDNGRKIGYLIGEGVWRWKLSEAQQVPETPVFNGLISSVVQYLSVKDDKRKFRVNPSKNTFDENEDILLNAVLYNDSYAPVNTPDVSIQIKNDEGKAYNYLFSRTESAYELNAGALPAGNYSYTASTVLGDKKQVVQGVFYINSLMVEYQQTIANHQLLYAMAAQTNGKMYMPQQLSAILKEIKSNEDIKTLSYEDRKYEELINYKWLFAMLITLLTLEWFFRKRNGEI